MKKLFLFDMDGTLTPPRQKMEMDIELMLSSLQEADFEVGIITGSDFNYIKQQCSKLFDLSLVDTHRIHFLPCNGTKYILNGKLLYSNDMSAHMGTKKWNQLMVYLISLQNSLALSYMDEMPLTGHFFNYRQSTLNWCPIGRNAVNEDRKLWESLDRNNKIRFPIMKQIEDYIRDVLEVDIVVKLGGDTSFDIFPMGWDKTYPLTKTKLLDEYNIFFVGDRCEQSGNDYELYSHPRTTSFKTTSPMETIEIVNKVLSSNV